MPDLRNFTSDARLATETRVSETGRKSGGERRAWQIDGHKSEFPDLRPLSETQVSVARLAFAFENASLRYKTRVLASGRVSRASRLVLILMTQVCAVGRVLQ